MGGPRARCCWRGLLVAVVLAAALAEAPSFAAAAACPVAEPTYTGNCGPTFVVPAWGDGGGWNDPSKYSTIQLADVNGDGRDELIGRNDQGLEIYWFDTSIGQWRPQVDANGVQQVLTDFRSPLPTERPATDWTEPAYYSTIQAANVAGSPGVEILARFSDGMRIYRYVPPPGNGIDGGSWRTIVTGGPFSDADGYGDASLYSTIGVGQFEQGAPPLLFARRHSTVGQASMVFYGWDGQALTAAPDAGTSSDALGRGVLSFPDQWCSQPSCYQTLRAGNLAPGGRDAPDDTSELIGRTDGGVSLWDLSALHAWDWLNEDYDFTAEGLPPFADHPSPGPSFPYPDCPFSAGGASGAGSSDCVGSSPSYYETLQAADIDGVAGDELLARASDGLRVRKWVPGSSGGRWDVLPTLTALAGAASGVPAGLWGSIRTGDIDGDGKREVLALDGKALQAWSYDPAAKAWRELQPSTPLALDADPWLSHPEYYSTIRVGDVDGDDNDDVTARGPFGIRTWFYNRPARAAGSATCPRVIRRSRRRRGRRRSPRSTRSPSRSAPSPRARSAACGRSRRHRTPRRCRSCRPISRRRPAARTRRSSRRRLTPRVSRRPALPRPTGHRWSTRSSARHTTPSR